MKQVLGNQDRVILPTLLAKQCYTYFASFYLFAEAVNNKVGYGTKIDQSQNKKWLGHIIITVIRGHGLCYAAVNLSPHYFEKRRRSWDDAYEAGDDWLKQFYHNRIFCFVCILWTSQFLRQQYYGLQLCNKRNTFKPATKGFIFHGKLIKFATIYTSFYCHATKNKLETVQWKKPRKWNVIKTNVKTICPSLRSLWATISELFAKTVHEPL